MHTLTCTLAGTGGGEAHENPDLPVKRALLSVRGLLHQQQKPNQPYQLSLRRCLSPRRSLFFVAFSLLPFWHSPSTHALPPSRLALLLLPPAQSVRELRVSGPDIDKLLAKGQGVARSLEVLQQLDLEGQRFKLFVHLLKMFEEVYTCVLPALSLCPVIAGPSSQWLHSFVSTLFVNNKPVRVLNLLCSSDLTGAAIDRLWMPRKK